MILETLSLTVRPQPSGEPDAGKPPVRFGGRGDFNTVVPTPIHHLVPTGQQISPTNVHKIRSATSRWAKLFENDDDDEDEYDKVQRARFTF
jgi:hypothetical protein